MSNEWYTILGPEEWDGVKLNTGNKKVDAKYFNILGDKNVQLSASGIMWLAAGSGIRLMTPGPVDASGVRSHDMHAIRYHKIDYSGNIVPLYSGSIGGITYKADDENIAAIPNDLLVYDSVSNNITMPAKSFGALHVTSGTNGERILDSYPNVQFFPTQLVGDSVIPPKVIMDAQTTFTNGIQIYPNRDGFKESILTHMGSGQPAEWRPAPYLKADGVLWNRFPKRPVKFDQENNRIIFYISKPEWAQDWVNSPSIEILETEFGDGRDTIEILQDDSRLIGYVKFASQIRYAVDDTDPDLVTPHQFLFESVSFKESEDSSVTYNGLAVKICPYTPISSTWTGTSNNGFPIGNGFGYAWSVTKGAYMDMQIGRLATYQFNCVDATDPSSVDDNIPALKFKPSTMNSISIRPNVNTAFNMLGEKIDFIVYGETKTPFNNYEDIFNVDSTNTPTGIIPAFRVHANVLNAVSGSISSGVYFSKYIDRSRVTPTGWSFDYKPKITINTNKPYIIDSIPSGTGVVGGVIVTGYITHYADLTINSTLYSQNIITDGLYLRPKPAENNQGEYIANALLTLDRSGKIISRIPSTNPTAPGSPTNVRLDPGHQNGIGNGEVSIVWNAPDSDGGDTIIRYLIQFSINDGESWTSIPNNLYAVYAPAINATAATISGLSAVVTYKFRIAAQNSIGIGDYSDPTSGVTVNSSVPKSPPNLQSVRAFDETDFSNIQLTWDEPQTGSDPILGYTIEESTDGGKTWYWYNEPNALITETAELVTGSISNIDYFYRVSAWNINGQSAFAYVKSASNIIVEVDPEEAEREQEKETDVLSNWDFGIVLFTGVCQL